MFSESYPSWGCRCCAADGGEEGGSSNPNWDLFDVEQCGGTKPPVAAAPTTTSSTTTENGCYDEQRGGCWNLGFVDHKSDAAGCQRFCAMTPDCNYWSYHPLRSDKRCHLCSADSDWSTCDEPGSCIWGPAVCPGDERPDALSVLYDAVSLAESFCSGSSSSSSSKAMLIAAESMNKVVVSLDSYFSDFSVLDEAANRGAAILNDGECSASWSACDDSAVLMLQIRGFLLLLDGHSERAFPDSTDRRKAIWSEHGVLVADNGFFDSVSLEAIAAFFDDLPPRLLSDGVLFGAPFATMTVRDAWRCGEDLDSTASSLLMFTDRGFNVFQLQVGDVVENAFPPDTDPVFGDLMMTVLRHEVSHQFDRVVDADPKLSGLETLLRSHCDSDDDYLRSQVGHKYFDSAPQEIVASQVGNQYFLDSPAQLRLALQRLDADSNPLPISWMLFFFELIGSGSNTVTLYKERSSTTGSTDSISAALRRDDDDRIVGLTVSGCDPFSFYYAQSGLVAGYSGPTDCVVDFSAGYTDSATMEQATWWNGNMAVIVVVVAAGCCLSMAICLWSHRRRRNKAMADGVHPESVRIADDDAMADHEHTEFDMNSISIPTPNTNGTGGDQEEDIMVDVDVAVAVTETNE